MSALAVYQLSLTPELYLAQEKLSVKKHEYVDGVVYAMAGAQNQHNSIVGSVFLALASRLRGKKCEPFNSDTKVRVRLPDQVRFYYPDVQVVCEPNAPEDSYQDRPVIIVEVLSDSTRRQDQGEKRDAYLTLPTLEHYLLIDSANACVVAYTRCSDGFQNKLHNGLEEVIPLTALGIELPLSEIYERVTVPALKLLRE
jgi:Uma2 family endonuclease